MQDHFLCRYCESDLAHRDDVEPGDELTCDCGTDYEIRTNDHPHFEVTIVKTGGPDQ